MSVRMRHTRAHTANRRSHHALTAPRLSACGKCGSAHVRHRMCPSCGTYKGKEVVNVLEAVQKKVQKRAEKMKALGMDEKTAVATK